ncbi:MAG: rhodanese-like domain-containing protein [Blastocatellales bacterium]
MKDSGFCLAVLLASVLLALPAYTQQGAQQGAAAQNEDENVPADRITINQLKRMMDAKEEVVIVDNRKGSSYLGSTVKIKGALHITLDELEAKMKDLPKNKLIVTYCT